MTIPQKLNNFHTLDLTKLGLDALVKSKAEYLALNIDQMREGFNPDGSRIGVYASPTYQRDKQKQNPRAGGWVDLILHGDFTRGMDIAIKARQYNVFSRDDKAEMLDSKYGTKNTHYSAGSTYFGLAQDNIQKYRETGFYSELMPLVKQHLNK